MQSLANRKTQVSNARRSRSTLIADVDTLTVHEYLSQSRWGGFDISVEREA